MDCQNFDEVILLLNATLDDMIRMLIFELNLNFLFSHQYSIAYTKFTELTFI